MKCQPAGRRTSVWRVGVAFALAAVTAASAGDLTVRTLQRVPAGARTVTQEARDIPIVAEADVVVVGGGVAGVSAALSAAAAGASVVLIEERNHFGYELAATLRPAEAVVRPGPGFAVTEKTLRALSLDKRKGIDLTGMLKGRLAGQVIKEKNIRPFLYSLANGALMDGQTIRGVVMVNPSGRQAVLAKTVVDATWDGRIAAAAGAEFTQSVGGEKTVRRYLLITNPAYQGDPEIAVPKSLGVLGDTVRVHEGGRVLEIAARMRIGGNVALDLSMAEGLTRRLAMRTVDYLRDNVKGFESLDQLQKAYPAVTLHSGSEIAIDEGPVVACDPPLTPRGVKGLLVAGRLASAEQKDSGLVPLLMNGETAGALAFQAARGVTLAAPTGKPVEVRGPIVSGGRVREFLTGLETGRTYPSIHENASELPIVDEVDVLVVGSGTAGAPAAIAAAQSGVRVAVVDVLPFLGGTAVSTIPTYYAGVPWESRLVGEIDAASGANRPGGRKGIWSPERRKSILQEMLLAHDAHLYYRTQAVGAVVEGRRVAGVVVEGAFGRGVILARVTVDGTGHGDVAATAGAAFSMGRQGDGATHVMGLTAGMANGNNGVRDPTSVADATAVTLKVMNWSAAGNTYSPHITPRESRHIVGDYVLTLDDLIARRVFPDAVMLCRSNYDRHDLGSYADESEAAQNWIAILGGWGQELGCQVPYRALLPRGLDNLLVVGKAYSGDHDSQVVLRMQRDYMHMGEAAGVAAAQAVRSRSTARSVSVKDLQAELTRRGVLRPHDLPGADLRTDPASAVLNFGSTNTNAQAAMIACYRAGPRAIPALTSALASTGILARAQAAVVLGMLGDRKAVPVLLEILAAGKGMDGEGHAGGWTSGKITPQLFTGAVILLGRFGEKQAAPGIRDLIKDRGMCPPEMASYAIPALEKIGDPSAVPFIKPYLLPCVPGKKPWPESATDESYAVQAAAARALAGMGDLSGIPVLIEFLGNDRLLVRDYAQKLLEGRTGQRFGKDQARWRAWFERRDVKATGGT